ncbi:MAG: hypothetical protein JXA42_05285 [Anaerolineales bacterium]|nr:hypothetical protein [Anaerolineales bacterium]
MNGKIDGQRRLYRGNLDEQIAKPKGFLAARALFLVNAVIWVALAVSTLARMAGGSAGGVVFGLVIAALMVGNAAGMLVCGVALRARRKPVYYLALGFLAINILLTFTDQFGLLDLITLVIDVVIVVLLIVDRE